MSLPTHAYVLDIFAEAAEKCSIVEYIKQANIVSSDQDVVTSHHEYVVWLYKIQWNVLRR